jgi:spermidine synthase
LASGFAGLAYEVVWTRMLSTVLGTEMAAVLGVVTGFFAGLGLGVLLLDGPIRRTRSPRRAYALLECGIAAWAVASVWLLPLIGRSLMTLLGAAPAPALLWSAGFTLPALVLLPATAAMGGTLIALERLTAALYAQPRVAAGVYGANTAGAVAGALAAVLLLLPMLGLSGTLLALAAVNLACAWGALALGPAADAPPPGRTAAAAPAAAGGVRLASTLAATGLLGILFELLVVRLAAQVLQDTILTFAFLLAAYLAGTAAGGLLWQRTGLAPNGRTLGRLLAATALACLGTAVLVRLLGPAALEAGPGFGPLAELGVACALFLPPAAAMGALFGCLLQAVRDRRGTLGWAVAVNSLGALAAPPVAALLMVPALGAWAALLPVALGYALLGMCWCGTRRAAPLLAVPAVAALALWLLPAPLLVRVPPGGALAELREGATATAAVVEGVDGTRYLEVNGHFRMGGTRSIRSDWRQAHLPLLLHPDPRRALFLGVGTGATLAGAAALPRVAATGVELTPEVAALLPWFAERGAPPLPPVLVADARRFVAAPTGLYDVVVADLFHPALDGTGALYTVEHFAAVRGRLAAGGVFCQWLPLYQFDLSSLRAIIRAFLDVYPEASAWLAHFSLQTPMLALCGGGGPVGLDPVGLAARLDDPAARAALRRTGLLAPLDVLGLYAGGAGTLRAFAGAGPRNTDDRPVVALDAGRNVRALQGAPTVLLLQVLRGLTPDAADLPGVTAPLAGRLAAYWRARNLFIEAGAALPEGIEGRALADAATPGLLEAVRLSPEFDPAYGPLLGMARSLLRTDRATGAALLRALDAAAPGRGEARGLLAQMPP